MGHGHSRHDRRSPGLPPPPNDPAATMSDSEELTVNLAVPKTSATLTVRIIKSFEFRTEKSLVLHNINLETTTVAELKEIARQGTPCKYILSLFVA